MDLIDAIDRLASRLDHYSDHLKTEEGTKHTLIMPVLNALGYNVFDPLEVIPEFTADVGLKKNEKVDYAIVIEGKPMILIECKTFESKLSLAHASQLYRYFACTDARFSVLTNGVEYWFYTDLDATNRMDEKPFFEFNLRDYDPGSVNELKKFAKANFDLENILSNASELKYAKQIGRLLAQEFDEPTEEFVKLLTNRVYSGRFTSSVHEQFRALVKNAFRQFIRDKVHDRLTSALRGGDAAPVEPAATASPPADQQAEDAAPVDADDSIVTTDDEIEAFHIVRAILAQEIEPRRVAIRDTKSYCGVLLDDNNRKPICRLRFNYSQKYLSLFDDQKNEERVPIESVYDIYKHADRLKAIAARYDGDEGNE